MQAPHIAIIGSGPAGCYTAQFLNKALPQAKIVVIDRLPVPFGLVRYGVAPDHVGTKNVIKQFERLFANENVTFLGNVEIGVDVNLSQLQDCFDVVVLATGLHQDKQLGIAGEQLSGVIGSGVLTRWSNDHPETPEQLNIAQQVVIVGNGNVAMDVARLLSKLESDFDGSEVRPEVATQVLNAQVTHIDIVSRSSMDEAKYDPIMLKELVKAQGVRLKLGHQAVGESDKSVLLHTLAQESDKQEERVTIAFHYGLTPKQLEGDSALERAVFVDKQGQQVVFDAQTLVTAIGFEADAHRVLQIKNLQQADSDLSCGYLQPQIYCVGWARRGPVGTIPENRKDAKLVSDAIVANLIGRQDTDKGGLKQLLPSIETTTTDFDDWLRLNQFELQQAPTGRHRLKIKHTEQMLQWINQAKQSV